MKILLAKVEDSEFLEELLSYEVGDYLVYINMPK